VLVFSEASSLTQPTTPPNGTVLAVVTEKKTFYPLELFMIEAVPPQAVTAKVFMTTLTAVVANNYKLAPALSVWNIFQPETYIVAVVGD
jgi:hypothetical protein